MKTVCEKNKCTGCMACLEVCRKNAVSIRDNLDSYNAVINKNCIDCGLCKKVCPDNNIIAARKPVVWYQGWSAENKTRRNGSSGGIAMAVAESFIKNGGTVCSCFFDKGKFTFGFADSISGLHKFAGSRYVKSSPSGIYPEIKRLLKAERKVLYIALPCQVAALYSYVGESLAENLYTADLICHGTPSPELLDIFFRQYDIDMESLEDISFRTSGKNRKYRTVVERGTLDSYSIAFLESMTYTENCYDCRYADIKRVSDITLGDSWGTELSAEEFRKGISLVLCQTEKGRKLIEDADVVIKPVDLKNAVAHNRQLSEPSGKPGKREEFFRELKKGKKFNHLVLKYYPEKYLVQYAKKILIRFGLMDSDKFTFQISFKKKK